MGIGNKVNTILSCEIINYYPDKKPYSVIISYQLVSLTIIINVIDCNSYKDTRIRY